MVLITGDLHADFSDYRISGNPPFISILRKDDYIIFLGDFGIGFNEETVMHWLRRKYDCTILFIRGNHDNPDFLNALPRVEMFGDVVGKLFDNTYELLCSHMYTICGKKYFVFSGAASIDSDWRKEYEKDTGIKIWWENEVPSFEDYTLAVKTLEKNDFEFDFFLSHTCTPELKGSVLNSYKAGFFDITETYIRDLECLIKENGGDWEKSFFGHFHIDKLFGKYNCLYKKVVDASTGKYINSTELRKKLNEEEFLERQGLERHIKPSD